MHAEELETSRLSYSVEVNGAPCPDEASFRNLVAARIGYDPFKPSGKHLTVVVLSERGQEVRGRAEVTHHGSAKSGVRELAVSNSECAGLTAALATAVAIAIDPVRHQQTLTAGEAVSPKPAQPAASSIAAPMPEAPRAPPPAPTVPQAARSTEKDPAPVPPQTARTKVSAVAQGGFVISSGVAPVLSLGGELAIGVRVSWFSLQALGRIESTPRASRVDSGAKLEVAAMTGGLALCANHGSGLLGCFAGRAGVLQGRAPEVSEPELGSSFYAALGIRGGYRQQLSNAIAVQAVLEGTAQLVRTTLKIDDKAVWTAPPVAASGIASIIWQMP